MRVLSALACFLAAAFVVPVAAWGSLSQEEGQGRQLAQSLRNGTLECGDLSADELELVGEYAMGRYLGDPALHEAMNRHMVQTMGEQGERRMHIALGYRYTGCRGGPAWSWMGPMAGMMYGGPGRSGGPYGYEGGMMGRSPADDDHDGFGGPWAAVMVGMMVVLIGAVLAGVFWLTRRPGPPGGLFRG